MVSQSEQTPTSSSGAHTSDDLLALLALGENVATATDDAHLFACSKCQSELDQLRAVVTTSRSIPVDHVLAEPPERVWTAIATELNLADSPSRLSVVRPSVDAQNTAQNSDDKRDPADVTGTSPATDELAARRARRWRQTGVLLAACVASLAVGVVATSVITRDNTTTAPTSTVVAAASLAALPDHTGNGNAEIITKNGVDYLSVDATDLTPGKGFYEVWLIDPKTMQMVGLGALDSKSGLFPIPAGLDLSKYRLVDVSLEPLDGVPTHSGDSIVRGELQV